MNLNGQIDWSDTDRIVSNDTRYISLNGSWWRESGMNTTYTVKHIQKGQTLFIKEVVG